MDRAVRTCSIESAASVAKPCMNIKRGSASCGSCKNVTGFALRGDQTNESKGKRTVNNHSWLGGLPKFERQCATQMELLYSPNRNDYITV
eukprot:4455599-Amphidinium_carterae.1